MPTGDNPAGWKIDPATGNMVGPGTKKLTAIADGTAATDGATKEQLPAAATTAASGLQDANESFSMVSVRMTTSAALPTYTYANGTAGVGATITATANGALAASVCDGVSPGAGTSCSYRTAPRIRTMGSTSSPQSAMLALRSC